MSKKSILAIAGYIFITGLIITSCNSPAEKVENAKEDVAEAQKELDKANEAYLEDVNKYRTETAQRIAENDSSIAELKRKTDKQKKEARAEYSKKVAELEQKNSDMKKRMDNYQADGKEKSNWEKFKTEFNHDMDELGQAFKDLTVNNVK